MSWDKKRMLLIISLLFTVSVVESQEKQHKDKSNLLDSSVRYGQLNNGLTYYLQKNDSLEKNIEFRFVVKVGINQKDIAQVEYAHLLEHLGYLATKHFPDKMSYYNKPGMYSHAYTGFDNTIYITSISSKKKESINEVLKSFQDITNNIILDKKSIDVQREAILGEIRTINPYRDWLNATIQKNLLSNTGYKYIDKKESKKSVEDFDYNGFLNFYKNWYTPDLEAIIVVGDINLDSIEKQIHEYYSILERRTKNKNFEIGNYSSKVNLTGHNRVLTIIDIITPTLQFKIFSKKMNEALNPKNRDDFKHMILQKLYQHLVSLNADMFEDSFHPSFSDFSSHYDNDELAGSQLQVTTMGVDIDTDNEKQLLGVIRKALVAWKQIHSGITDLEFQKAKKELLKNLTNDNSSSSVSLANRYHNHFVKGSYAMDPDEELLMLTEILKKIDLQEIQAYVHKAGDLSENTDFVFLKNEVQKVPEYAQIKNCIDEVQSKNFPPIKSQKDPIKSLPKVACNSNSNVFNLERLAPNIIGVSTITLKNGIKLILKPLKPSSNNYNRKLQLMGYRENNNALRVKNEYLKASLIPDLINFMGAGDYSKFEIEEFKRAHDIKLNFEFNKDMQSIYGESKVSEIEELLNLINLYASQPRKDNDGFVAWKKYKKQELQGKLTRGSSDFYLDEIYALRYPEIPQLGSEEVEDLTLNKIFRAYDKWFTGFEGYTFIVTGDFEIKEIVSRLTNSLSCFPIENSSKTDIQDITKFPLERMEETIFLKNIDQAMVTLSFPFKVENTTKNMILLKHIEKALNEKIWTRLRDGCFSPRAYGKWEEIRNGIYTFNVSFDSAIGNQQNMIEMALETFNDLKKEGVTSDWLKNNINIEADSYDRKLEYFGLFNKWPNYLQTKLSSGENIAPEILQYKTLLEHFVSIDELNVALQKYLNDDFLQKFIILPEQHKI
ncbi:M16 family metallopeptidase [Gillisia sp. Hel_I_29]|uniref:M16 family metallopeptidase n=1 Tax=Gillisia sp. Hel_I_29 TaxID=1249975 RepID=UPI000A67E4F4|nr:insulinase family protein [Gillisia sp. Hel_I_29]